MTAEKLQSSLICFAWNRTEELLEMVVSKFGDLVDDLYKRFKYGQRSQIYGPRISDSSTKQL